jgi:hypothetical protein
MIRAAWVIAMLLAALKLSVSFRAFFVASIFVNSRFVLNWHRPI